MRTINDFDKALNSVSKHSDVLDTLEKFLEWVIAGFSHTIKLEREYSQEEVKDYYYLLQEWVLLMDDAIKGNEWFDAFGSIYEMNASKSRRSNKGQFFTPEPIVTFQCLIVGTEEKGLRISDPACGSGRYAIAHHSLSKGGNFYSCEDIDRLCCLMTVANMLMHGTVGEVIWHNSLLPDSYFGGWSINTNLNSTGVPHIEHLELQDSFVYKVWVNYKETNKNDSTDVDVPLVKPKNKKKDKGTDQLSFDFNF